MSPLPVKWCWREIWCQHWRCSSPSSQVHIQHHLGSLLKLRKKHRWILILVFEEPCGAEHRRCLWEKYEQTEGYRSKQKSLEGITPDIIPVAPLKLPSPIQELKGTGWEVVGDIAVNLHSKGMVAVWVAGLSRYKQGDNHATGAELTGEQRNSMVTSLTYSRGQKCGKQTRKRV